MQAGFRRGEVAGQGRAVEPFRIRGFEKTGGIGKGVFHPQFEFFIIAGPRGEGAAQGGRKWPWQPAKSCPGGSGEERCLIPDMPVLFHILRHRDIEKALEENMKPSPAVAVGLDSGARSWTGSAYYIGVEGPIEECVTDEAGQPGPAYGSCRFEAGSNGCSETSIATPVEKGTVFQGQWPGALVVIEDIGALAAHAKKAFERPVTEECISGRNPCEDSPAMQHVQYL